MIFVSYLALFFIFIAGGARAHAERALVPLAPTSPDGVGAKTVPTNVEPEGGRIVESLIAGGEAESAEAAASSSGRPAELQQLLDGNARFAGLQVADPGKVLATVAEGQTPQFAFVGCSDSRVPESKIFDSDLGALFTVRNIGNQFRIDDLTTQTVTSYGIEVLRVKHILITGHYGCGAIAAAIATPFADADTSAGSRRIETWIEPIRLILATSQREELVAFRQTNLNSTSIPEPERENPAFRALVEENVKSTVAHVAADPVIQKAWRDFIASQGANSTSATETPAVASESEATAERAASLSPAASIPASEPSATASEPAEPEASTASLSGPTSFFEGERTRHRRSSHGGEEAGPPQELWVHGLVYDIDTGLVKDLGVSVSSASLG